MGVFENDFILNESFFPKILLYKLFVDIFMITKATPTEMLMFLYYLKKNCFSGETFFGFFKILCTAQSVCVCSLSKKRFRKKIKVFKEKIPGYFSI